MAGFSSGNFADAGVTVSTVISAGDMSANLAGIGQAPGSVIGLQFVWTGSPVGTLFIDLSDDYVPGVNNGTWEDVSSVLSLPTVSGAGQHFQTLVHVASAYVRVRYVRTSGTGTLNVTLSVKE